MPVKIKPTAYTIVKENYRLGAYCFTAAFLFIAGQDFKKE
ncbi:hypothetical protein SAMN05720354_11714 [Nitrosospira sp. Nsp1]|nr:hypothetical protein SAMN05720354_11714 [Nitrosospira sp. Nsp1]